MLGFERTCIHIQFFFPHSATKEKDLNAVKSTFTFEMPVHYGNHVLKTSNEFQMPYDIWWLYDRDMVKIWNCNIHK